MSGASPESGQWMAREHHLPVRVYYEDTDFTGVVYYANYLKFLERGRTDALRTAGIRHEALLELETPLGFAVRKITAEYLIPARIDDALRVVTRIEQARGARMIITQRIERGDDILLTADIEAVCIDLDGRPRRLPKDMLTLLSAVIGT